MNTWWKRSGTFSNDYEVEIQYKNGEADSSVYRGSTNARLIADRIPDWLEKETAYQWREDGTFIYFTGCGIVVQKVVKWGAMQLE